MAGPEALGNDHPVSSPLRGSKSNAGEASQGDERLPCWPIKQGAASDRIRLLPRWVSGSRAEATPIGRPCIKPESSKAFTKETEWKDEICSETKLILVVTRRSNKPKFKPGALPENQVKRQLKRPALWSEKLSRTCFRNSLCKGVGLDQDVEAIYNSRNHWKWLSDWAAINGDYWLGVIPAQADCATESAGKES